MHVSLLVVAALTLAGLGAESINYDAARQGQLPPGWSAPAAHQWEVRSDKTAPSHPNVFRGASGETGKADPPLALFDKIVCRDGDLSVKFRIDGNHGNAAGVVWRYQDPQNYYLLSLSADDKNIVLQRIHSGVASVIATTGGKPAPVGVAEDIRAGQWHVVKVSFRGPKVQQVFFGNRSVFTAQDSGIPGAGKTGLWAKGPNGAAFDDFRIDRKS